MTDRTHNESSPVQRLEQYVGFKLLGIKVLALDSHWRSARICLPLNANNRNPGGFMFGGAQACLADPVAALACCRLFPDYAVWTRRLYLDFVREGRSDLELRFAVDEKQEHQILRELASRGRSTPTFEYAYFDRDNTLCTRISCDVAIRSRNEAQ